MVWVFVEYGGQVAVRIGDFKVVRQGLKIGLQVIIRPRGGDFYYSDLEFELMRQDILAAKAAGTDGVVLAVGN